MTIFLATAIANAQQCLLGKEAVWLRERPMFEGSNEPRMEILNCHQSLIRGKKILQSMFSFMIVPRT